jgi:hypothetical protein
LLFREELITEPVRSVAVGIDALWLRIMTLAFSYELRTHHYHEPRRQFGQRPFDGNIKFGIVGGGTYHHFASSAYH